MVAVGSVVAARKLVIVNGGENDNYFKSESQEQQSYGAGGLKPSTRTQAKYGNALAENDSMSE